MHMKGKGEMMAVLQYVDRDETRRGKRKGGGSMDVREIGTKDAERAFQGIRMLRRELCRCRSDTSTREKKIHPIRADAAISICCNRPW